MIKPLKKILAGFFLMLLTIASSTPLMAQGTGQKLIDETFDTWTSTATIPTGWATRKVAGTASANYYWKHASSATAGRNSTRCAYGYFTTTYKSGMLISPSIQCQSDQILRFWLKATYIDHGQLIICASSDAQGQNITNYLDTVMPTTASEWQLMEVSLKPLTSATNSYHIVFYVPEVPSYTYFYVDDVVVEEYPGCQPAEFDNTTDIRQTTATLNWTYGTGNFQPGTLNIQVVDTATNQVVFSNAAYPGNNTSINVTGLTAGRVYRATAQGDCTGAQSGQAVQTSTLFTTAAAPQSLPISQDFEGSTSIPIGWTINAAYQAGTTINTSSSYVHGGSKSLKLYTAIGAAGSAELYTPQINQPANNIQIDFWAKPSTASASAPRKITVVLVDTTNTLAETLLDTNMTSTTTWYNFRFTTANVTQFPTMTNCRILFRVDPGTAANTIYIDDINIMQPPTCLRPEDLTAYHQTDNSVILRWTDIEQTTDRQICISRTGAADSLVLVNTNPYTINNLTPNTTYTFKVRSICSASDTGEWSTTVQAATMCAPLTSAWTEDFDGGLSSCWNWIKLGGTSGTMTQSVLSSSATTYAYGKSGNYFKSYCLTTGNDQDWILVSQPLTVPTAGMYDLYFNQYRYYTTSSASYTATTKVWVNNYPDTVGATFLTEIPYNAYYAPAESKSGVYEYSANIPLSGNVYVIFEYTGYGYMYLDHIHIENRPGCRAVSDIHFEADSANATSVLLDWTGDTETQWIVKYSLNDGTTIHSDSLLVSGASQYRITGLDTAHVYAANVTVWSYCGATEIGDAVSYSGNARTKTAIPANLPYSEDFESFTTEELGDGTFTISPAYFTDATTPYGASSINTTSSYLPSGSTKNLKLGNSTAAPTYLYFPEFVNQVNGIQATFNYRHYSTSATYTDSLRYGYLKADGSFVQKGYFAPTTTQMIATVTIDSIPVGAHFAFRYGGNYNSNYYGVYLDNINITEKPECASLGFPSADSVTYNIARVRTTKTISYKWEVAYGVTGTAIEQCDTVRSDEGDQTITITGLQPNTGYDFYARQICSETETSPWTTKRTFTTLCAPDSLTIGSKFYDNFEDFGTSKIAGCYVQENTTSSYYWRRVTTRTYDTNTGCLYAYGSAANGIPGLYRLFHLEAQHLYEVAAAQYGYSSSYSVDGVFAYGTTADRTMMTEIGRIEDVPYSQWQYGKFYFIPAVTGDYYVGVYAESDYSSTSYLYMDTLTLRELSCIPPVVNTINVTTTSAAVNYTNYSRTAQIQISTDEDMTTILRTVTQSSDSSVITLNNLTPGTRYYYQMRLLCSATDSSDWTAVSHFDTYCTSKTVPYTEGFESDAALICWTALGNDAFDRSSSIKRSGSSSMHVQKGSVSSPEIAVTSLTSVEFSGYVRANADNTSISFGVSTDPSDPSAFSPLSTVVVANANTWQEFVLYFDDIATDPDAASAKYITFSTVSTNDLYFDDIKVQTAPACRRPTELTATAVTDTSVTLSWTTNNQNESSWQVRYGTTVKTVTTNPVTIGGLMGNTDYTFEVASLCTQISDFSAPLTVRTNCPSVAETPWNEDFESYAAQSDLASACVTYSPANLSGTSTYPYFTINTSSTYLFNNGGNRCLKMVASKTAYSYYILPVMDVAVAQLELSFNYHTYSTTTTCPDLTVGLMTNPSDTSTFITIEDLDRVSYSTGKAADATVINFATKTIPTGYENAHIVFRNGKSTTQSSTYSSYLDNISVKQIRSCSDPENVRIENLRSTSAELHFHDTAAHTNWQYILALEGENYRTKTPVSLTDSVAYLTALTAETAYNIYVRAYCDAQNQSNWIKVEFSTPASPVTLPYVCDFETQGADWRNLQGETNNYFIVGTDPAAVKGGSKALYITDDGVNNHSASVYNTSYAYVPVEFNSNMYEINFDWLATGGYSTLCFGRAFLVPSDFELQISATSTAPTGLTYTALPTGAIALDGGNKMNLQNDWMHQDNIIDMTGKAGAYKVVFYWRSYSSTSVQQAPLSVDNLVIREITCPMVDSIATIDSLKSDTTLGFSFVNASGAGATTEYRLSLSGDYDDYVLTGTTTGNTLVLSPLSPSQHYTLFLRNVCSATDMSPWSSLAAYTNCGTVNALPLVNAFETVANVGATGADCWTNTNLTPAKTTSKWTTYTSTTYYKSGKGLKLAGAKTSSALYTSPLIHFDGSREYHVTFYMYNYATATYTDKLTLYTTPDANSVDLGTKFFEQTAYNSEQTTSGIRKYDIDIPAGTDGDLRIALQGDYNYSGYLYVSDFTIDIYPACRELTNLPELEFVGDNFATISINDFHPSWQYAWTLNGNVADTVASVVTSSESVTVTGLTPDTTYTFYARAFCNNGDTTDWVLFGSGRTKANSCFAPSGISIISATCDTAATFTWFHGSQANNFAYSLTSASDTVSGTIASDTLSVTGLTENANYTLAVSYTGSCDTTYTGSLNFTTTAVPAVAPYICNFEDDDENDRWIYTNASTNKFVIGTAATAVKDGSSALYVTNSTSTEAYAYTLTTANLSFASRILNLNEGVYQITYDWKGYGESTYDYARVFLLPASKKLTASNSTTITLSGLGTTTLPSDAISLDSATKRNLAANWCSFNDMVSVEQGGLYNFVVAWRNDASGGAQPPFSIDNISLTEINCVPLTSVAVGASDTFADAVITRSDAMADVIYGVSRYNNPDSVLTTDTLFADGEMRDTVRITGLTSNTQYYLFARQHCSGAVNSNWTVESFRTLQDVTPLPFVADFETTGVQGWTYIQNNQANVWVIDTAESFDSQKSMYISNNNGVSASYDNTTAAVSFATRTFYFAPGNYEFAFDWKGNGESNFDYMRVILVDPTLALSAGSLPTGVTYSASPEGSISLDGGKKLNLSTSWQSRYYTTTITSPTAYKLMIMWRNDGSSGTAPSACIDNIMIREITCPQIDTIYVSNQTTTGATLTFSRDSMASGYIYAYSTGFNRSQAVFDTIRGSNTVSLTGLQPSTRYNVWVSAICSADDESSWYQGSFQTACAAIDAFPFSEDFEGMSSFPYVCWTPTTVTPGTTTSGAWEIYEGTSTSTYRSSGTHCMRLGAGGGTVGDNLIALPQMNFQAGHHYDLAFNMYRTTSTYYINQMKIWLGANNTSTSGGTLLGTYMPDVTVAPVEGTSGNYRYTIDIPDSASGLKYITFQGLQRYSSTSITYIYVDDIRVTEWVEGSVFTDTVCGNYSDYTGYGFNIAARDIQSGLNTFTRRVYRNDVADTVYTLNLYRFAPAVTYHYDTICSGDVYSGSGFQNLTQPGSYVSQGLHSYTGCDSTVYLTLFVYDSTATLRDTICQGDVYTFGGQSLTQSGTYVDTITNPHGCDIVTTLYLFVVDSTSVENATICQGESYTFEGGTYTQAGTYRVAKTGAHSCPLMRILNLSVTPTDSTVTVSFCKGGSVQVIDTVITSAGNYTITRVSTSGCDITYHITATEDPVREGYVSDNACQGYPYSGYGVQGVTITQDTVILVNTKTIDGKCDSVGHVSLTFVPTSYGEDSVWIKQGESYTWHNQTYNTAGDYTDTISSSLGCDSICTLHLKVSGTAVDNVNEVIVNIVPNPVTAGSTAYVTGDFTSDVTAVEILNSYGQVVDRFTPQTYPIEVQGINAAGLYYVRLTTRDGAVHLQKLIVK